MPEDVCSVAGCGQTAARSLSTKKVKEVLPELHLAAETRRTHLCRDHYRQFRKNTKEERELERLGW